MMSFELLAPIEVVLIPNRVQNYILIKIGNQQWTTVDKDEARTAAAELHLAFEAVMALIKKLPN